MRLTACSAIDGRVTASQSGISWGGTEELRAQGAIQLGQEAVTNVPWVLGVLYSPQLACRLGSWSTEPPSCFCRADAGAFVGGRLFVMGGWRRPDLTYTGLADVESYDPNSNSWCPSKPDTSLNPKPQTLSSR